MIRRFGSISPHVWGITIPYFSRRGFTANSATPEYAIELPIQPPRFQDVDMEFTVDTTGEEGLIRWYKFFPSPSPPPASPTDSTPPQSRRKTTTDRTYTDQPRMSQHTPTPRPLDEYQCPMCKHLNGRHHIKRCPAPRCTGWWRKCSLCPNDPICIPCYFHPDDDPFVERG